MVHFSSTNNDLLNRLYCKIKRVTGLEPASVVFYYTVLLYQLNYTRIDRTTGFEPAYTNKIWPVLLKETYLCHLSPYRTQFSPTLIYLFFYALA